MGMIKGIDVVLINKVEGANDPFGNPMITTGSSVTVHNVLVEPTVSADTVDSKDLSGRRITATLAIPKGDTHTWTDSYVEFFGHRWATVGGIMEGIESMMPLSWHKKIRVERYE